MMKDTKEEFLGTLCSIYIVFLLVVLPLYTGSGYYQLGDAKYQLFFNVSVICQLLYLVLSLLFFLQRRKVKRGFGIVDIFVLSYGFSGLLSARLSAFDTAWGGYQDWYMGAVSQLLFVGIYFLVSRCYVQNALIIYLGEAAFFTVTIIGLLNRLGLDPLGLLSGFCAEDWEYSHMLSTVGNINWLCGYYSVVLAFPLSGYLQGKKRGKSCLLYIVSLLGLLLLCIQGSDSGVLIVCAALGVGFVTGIKRPERFFRCIRLAVGLMLMLPIMGMLVSLFDARASFPSDGGWYERMFWTGWWPIALILVAAGLCHRHLAGKQQERIAAFIVLLGALTTAAASIFILCGSQQAEWGSGRMKLWNMAWKGFCQADILQKLFGAGPDCFAEYLSSIGIVPVLFKEGRWAGAIYANAHNEWLSQLVNVGILGTVCYLGIFVAGLRRYRGMLLGVLAIVLYGIHSFVSFQQVMNTPLFFLVLGLCESVCRRQQHGSQPTA